MIIERNGHKTPLDKDLEETVKIYVPKRHIPNIIKDIKEVIENHLTTVLE